MTIDSGKTILVVQRRPCDAAVGDGASSNDGYLLSVCQVRYERLRFVICRLIFSKFDYGSVSKLISTQSVGNIPCPEESRAFELVELVAEALASSVKAANEQQVVFMMREREERNRTVVDGEYTRTYIHTYNS